MSNVAGSYKGQQDIIVLLTLKFVHCGYFVGHSNHGIVGTPEKKMRKNCNFCKKAPQIIRKTLFNMHNRVILVVKFTKEGYKIR